jgi:hypothetical protein
MEKFTAIYPRKTGLVRESEAMPTADAFLFFETWV